MYITRIHGKQQGGCEVRVVNSMLGQQWASTDAGWKNFIVQRPRSNSSVREQLLHIDKSSAYYSGKNSQNIYFCDPFMSSLTWRELGHICDRHADFKQDLGLVKPQYTKHDKNIKSKHNTTWDPDDWSGCHDRRVLLF